MFIEHIPHITPAEAFMRLRGLPMPFIFSSGVSGKTRYSFAGAAPSKIVKARYGTTTVTAQGGGDIATCPDHPMDVISGILKGYGAQDDGSSRFCGGAAGYFAYSLKDHGSKNKDQRGGGLALPDCIAGIYESVYAYDHKESKAYIISAKKDVAQDLINALKGARAAAPPEMPAVEPAASGYSASITRQGYINAVRKAQDYISEGDIYQINLSQMLTIPWRGDPFALYARLLETCPSAYPSYMDFGDFQLISNSPERLLKAEGGWVETEPIKGTRPRGADPEHDRRMIEELKSSPKERAEHVMIVDLERNDLGMVTAPGTVEVSAFESIETYRGLHHMVSTVKGRLRGDIGPLGCLKAAFPGGSVTGAPKKRAIEIIDELENIPRGVYTGAIGWAGFCGDMDMYMAIRTAVYKDGALYLHVGGGIVADSVPEDEYDETILKARDFLTALSIG